MSVGAGVRARAGQGGPPPLRWEPDGDRWPHRESSRFVDAGSLTWHVQVAGDGPVILLVHGTGAATHTWRALLPRLATRYTVVAMDLPGHGFTERPAPQHITLPGLARQLADLVDALGMTPAVVAGHSAAAPLLAQTVLDGRLAPRALISLNGAWRPYGGLAERLYSELATVLAGSSLVAGLVARHARKPHRVARLIRSTGSTLDDEGVRLYGQLLNAPAHVSSVLRMMAQWELQPLLERLDDFHVPTLAIAGRTDRAVAPVEAEQIARRLPRARALKVPGGHLAHEEYPAELAAAIEAFDVAVLEGDSP